MFNMDKDQTVLQTSLMDTDEEELTVTLMEARDNLNLYKVKMVPLHFCSFVRNYVEMIER